MLSPSGSTHGTRTAPTPLTGQPPETMSFPSTLRHPLSAVLYIWVTSFPIPTQTPWLASGACAAKACFIRWAGMTTVCRPNGVYRIITACRVMRRLPTLRTSSHRFAVTHQKIIALFRSLDPTSLSCVKNSQLKTKRSLKIYSAVLAYQSTGRCCTPQLKTAHVVRANVLSCATLHAVRHTHKKHQHCGTLIFALQLHKLN
ncbi:unannotated protein [freshwater metagenome]|uniref:Unannotated protein n=1 Tax=freshwater metagenome TaxID=449393 RepID=A0A6J6AI39_9ZZZZ